MGAQEFGAFLKERRERLGLNKAQLARAVDVVPSYVTRLEKAQPPYKSVGHDVVRRLAAVIGEPEEHLEALLYDRPVPLPARREPELTREIPVVGRVSMGVGGGGPIDAYVYWAISETRGRLLKAVIADGTCMEPLIHEGAVVILDAAATGRSDLRDGDIVVATLLDSDEHVLKQYFRPDDRTVRLVPLVGEPIVVAADRVKIEGRVVEWRQRPPRRP